METKYQTSFIPKKPIEPVASRRSGGSMGLLTFVSIIIFLVSIGLAGYVFLERKLLIQQINTDQATISANKDSFTADSVTIENLIELNSRINVAKDLLNKHITVSPVFDFLQKATLRSVMFKNFSFSSGGKDSSGVSRISVQMSGVAPDWETVALQADEFGKSDYKKNISEPKISNLSVNTDGSISFQFSAYVAEDYLMYGNSLGNNNATN
jgi:hypothetical protein